MLHEETAQIITNAIAVATTLTLPRLLVLLQVSLPFILKATRYLPRLFPRRKRSRLTSHILETFRDAETIGVAASRLTRRHLGMQHVTLAENDPDFQRRYYNFFANFQEDKWTFSIICLGILSLGAFYIGMQAVAILTSGIVSGNFGLSNSPDCGWWIPPPVVSSTIPYQVPPFVLPSEAHYESINYAERHYGTTSMSSAGSAFVSQRISYKENLCAPCPFDHRCCAGENPAFLVDTGYQSSRILGINTAEQHLFRMQTVCTPLNSQLPNGTVPIVLNSNSMERVPTSNASMDKKSLEQSFHARPGDSYNYMRITRNESCFNYNYLFKYVISCYEYHLF